MCAFLLAALLAGAARGVEIRVDFAAPAVAPVSARPELAPNAAPDAGALTLPASLSAPELAAPQLQTAAPLQTALAPDAPLDGPKSWNELPVAVTVGAALFDGRLPEGPAASAELSRVALLDTPGESLDARVTLTRSAKSTIYAGYFAFFPDAAGLAKLALLRDAARRGKTVRLLLDAYGNKLPKAMLKHLVDEGVEVRLYHPFRWSRPSWLWRRSHDKWTIVDGEEAVLGDANMAKHYFGMGKRPWTSREVYVAGAAARAAQAYADKIWSSGETAPPSGLGRVSAEEAARAGRSLDAYDRHFETRSAVVDYSLKPWAERAYDAPVRFTANTLIHPNRYAGTGRDLLRMIRRARHTIVIENSYVVLPEPFKLELEKAIRERGARVVLVTNSYETNNLHTAKHAYEADVPRLVRMGIELYEFKGPGTLHAKGMVIDGDRTYLGSYNLDPRSLLFNTETGVIVDSRAFARDLLAQIERSRRNSTLVGLRGSWKVESRRFPVLSRLWGLLRRLLLIPLRDQV